MFVKGDMDCFEDVLGGLLTSVSSNVSPLTHETLPPGSGQSATIILTQAVSLYMSKHELVTFFFFFFSFAFYVCCGVCVCVYLKRPIVISYLTCLSYKINKLYVKGSTNQ